MKQFVGGIALIRRDSDEPGVSEWLTLWNEGRGCWHFPEAHKLDGESFRQSLTDEIAWQTGLRKGKDYLVSGAPRAHVQEVEGGCDPDKAVIYVVEFYLVELMGKLWRETLGEAVADGRSRWITVNDLEGGRVADKPIDPRQTRLLKRADVMAPHQVDTDYWAEY
ncbi:MAG: hypothetical protein AAGJ97_00850 [Planctomycetota bacterium]